MKVFSADTFQLIVISYDCSKEVFSLNVYYDLQYSMIMA